MRNRFQPVERLDVLGMRITSWVCRTLGRSIFTNTKERAKRVLEEAIELAQAEDVPLSEARDLVAYVYSRPVGEVSQEAAGLGFCWIAYGESKGLHLLDLVEAELDRVDTPEMVEKIRKKHDMKAESGISMQRNGD